MRLLLVIIPALAALTAACDGDNVRISSTTETRTAKGVLKVIDALQCPDTLGGLTRIGSAQSGGAVCTYSGPRGAEVSLHLVALDNQTADEALKAFETRILAAMPHSAAQMQGGLEDAAPAAGEAESAGDAASAVVARADRGEGEVAESVTIRAPGMRIDTDGDQATVRLPGLSVDADGDRANVRIGGFSIQANDDSSVNVASGQEMVSIQTRDDSARIRTRAPGDATRQTFLLTDNRPSDAGWRLAGYEARGPRGGPIVIATVRAKERHNDGVFGDAKALVTLNVGE